MPAAARWLPGSTAGVTAADGRVRRRAVFGDVHPLAPGSDSDDSDGGAPLNGAAGSGDSDAASGSDDSGDSEQEHSEGAPP